MELANNDLTKIPYLKSKVSHKTLYEIHYKSKVEKLNDMIDSVAQMEYQDSLKSSK
ncbi:hypothetical protein IT417_03660 [bacterium]|nr:hypothetical protein [bacterium]